VCVNADDLGLHPSEVLASSVAFLRKAARCKVLVHCVVAFRE
jgi:hypothetical protein